MLRSSLVHEGYHSGIIALTTITQYQYCAEARSSFSRAERYSWNLDNFTLCSGSYNFQTLEPFVYDDQIGRNCEYCGVVAVHPNKRSGDASTGNVCLDVLLDNDLVYFQAKDPVEDCLKYDLKDNAY